MRQISPQSDRIELIVQKRLSFLEPNSPDRWLDICAFDADQQAAAAANAKSLRKIVSSPVRVVERVIVDSVMREFK